MLLHPKCHRLKHGREMKVATGSSQAEPIEAWAVYSKKLHARFLGGNGVAIRCFYPAAYTAGETSEEPLD